MHNAKNCKHGNANTEFKHNTYQTTALIPGMYVCFSWFGTAYEIYYWRESSLCGPHSGHIPAVAHDQATSVRGVLNAY